MIPEAIVQRTRDATDIVELLSGYVKLRKRGQNYVGLCPFHSEKTPSFNVNPARQIYHCFGCGKGGDVFRFLMDHERMGFVEAIKLLAERAHIEIPRSAERDREPLDRLYRAQAVALEYFRRALQHPSEGERARAYLASRKIPEALVDHFEVGFAPPRLRGLVKYAERHDLGLRDLEGAGLVLRGAEGTRDRFCDRLMFPIRNLSGKPIAFGGRDLSGRARAKYLNSPETPIYQKGRVLYGLFEARRSIQDANEALVCEGYFDLLRLHEHGFTHAVAVSGTALTPDQARLLARHATQARLIFDADGPGQAAALRSVAVLFDAGIDVWFVHLARGEDPDSFLESRGAAALRAKLESAGGYVAFLEEQAGSAFVSLPPAHQNRLLREIAETLARISDPVRRELLTHLAWSHFGISETVFRRRMTEVASHKSTVEAPRGGRLSPQADWRLDLLQLLIQDPESRQRAVREVTPMDFKHQLHKDLISYLSQETYIHLDASELVHHASPPELARLVGSLAARELPEGRAVLDDYLLKLRCARLEDRSQELLLAIQEAERQADGDRVATLTREYQKTRSEWLRLSRTRRRDGF
jgi:DNA primase